MVGDRPPDLLVFTGDMIDQSIQRDRLVRFFDEIRSLYNGPILAVPGNHEAQANRSQASRMALPMYWERFAARFRRQRVQFLLDRYAEIEVGQDRTLQVAGLGWDPIHGRVVSDAAAHAASEDIVGSLGIPEGCRLDLLLHHAPPRGILDKTRRRGTSDSRRSMGSGVIRQVVETLKPTVSVFGHCHESAGFQQIGDTLFVNACVFDTRRGYSGVPMLVREFELDLSSATVQV